MQSNNESPKPFQLSMWGSSGHAPLGSPGAAFYYRDCFEAGCSGLWAAGGVRSCHRGAALSHMPSHHTYPALPTPLSHCITLPVCVIWPLGDGQRCLLQLPATNLPDRELRMSWVHACETDRWPCCHPAHLSCCIPLPLHPWTSKFLCPPQLAEHRLLFRFFIPPVPWHQN